LPSLVARLDGLLAEIAEVDREPDMLDLLKAKHEARLAQLRAGIYHPDLDGGDDDD
jgi:hypothetical protein